MFNYLAAKSSMDEGFATLDLQLFSEEEVVETTETAETTTEEVAAETVEEAPAEVTPEPTAVVEDVTQTQAFAHRLKEETAKVAQSNAQSNVDSYISKQGYVWNNKPITTEAEYDQALYEQKMAESGTDADAVKALVDSNPDVIRAREADTKAQAQQRDYAEYLDLVKDYVDIKDPSQIPAEVWQMKADKGISLLDAQNRIAVRDFKAQLAKTKLDTEQETIKKISKNAATSPGSASDGNVSHQGKSVSDMSAAEFEAYREEVSNR